MFRSSISNPPTNTFPFLLLDENRFAYTAVNLLLDQPTATRCKRVFVHGPHGCGKSHLADYLSQESRRRRRVDVVRLLGSDLIVEDADSLSNRMPELYSTGTNIGRILFICEDIQAIARHPIAQLNLVRIIDDCERSECNVLLTSNSALSNLGPLSPKLQSRLHGSACASIRLPSVASRFALLQHFCSNMQIPIASDVINLFSRECAISPRDLLSTLNRFDQQSRSQRHPPNLSLARSFLAREHQRPSVTVDLIAKAACREFGLTLADLCSQSRDQKLKTARQCAMFLTREITSEKLSSIGEYFGNRSHSTVLHACHQIKTKYPDNPKLRQHLDAIKRRLVGTLGELPSAEDRLG